MNIAWYQYKNMHLFLKNKVKYQPKNNLAVKAVAAKT